MFLKNKIIWTVVIGTILISCPSMWISEKSLSRTPRPLWIEEPGEGYFVGVSPISKDEYTARLKATANARKQIVESLGGLVESELIDQISEKRGSTEVIDEFSQSKVKVISKNIISVKPEKIYIESWEKRVGLKKHKFYRAYVLVPFSRKDHEKFIKEYIACSFITGSKLYDKALNFMKKGNVTEAMNVIHNIKKNIKPVLELTGVRPSLKLDIMYLNDDVEGLRRTILKRITLQPLKESYTGTWGQALNEPIKVKLFLSDKAKTPIEGIPITFRIISGEADITEPSQTDKNGIAICTVNRIKSPENLIIEAKTIFPENSGIKEKKCRIYINQDNSALLLTDEKYLSGENELRILGDIISQELTRKNFKLTYNTLDANNTLENFPNLSPSELNIPYDEHHFIIIGYLYITRYKKIDEGFYFAWCNAGIKFYNTSTGELLASFVQEEKEAGNSLKDAEIKVANKTARALISKLIKELRI